MQGASFTLIAQICSFSVQTVGTIILARLLTPHDFGLVTMVLSLSLLLQSIGVNGFLQVVIQRDEINHGQVSTLFWMNAGVSGVLMLVFIAIAPLIVWFYKEPAIKHIIWIMSFTIPIGNLATQHQALLFRNMQFFRAAVCEIISSICSLGISIVLAFQGFGYWALVIKWLTAPIILSATLWFACRWRPSLPSKDAAGSISMLKFAFSTYGTWCLGYMGKSIDKILIGRFLGSQPLGHYDRAYHLSLMLPNQLVSPLTNVAMATLSRLSQDEEKLRSTYLSILSTIAFVGVPLSAVLTLVGKDLIVLLLGSHWQKAGELFTAFGFSIAVFMLYMTHGWIHLSLGTPHRWLKWSVIALMVKASFIIGGLQFGITGVAIAYTASYYLLMGPGLIYAGMPMGLRLYHILAVTWRYFVAGLVSGLLSWIVVSHVDDRFGVFVQMTTRTTLSLVLSLSTYLLMVILLYGSVRPIMRLFDIMREMIPRRSGLL